MNHRNRFLWLLVVVCCLVLPELNKAQSRPAADLIITNAKIWTVDKSLPRAEAVAVLGDRIVAVGSSADVDAWRGRNTHVIDADGKMLLPGFNDAHVHFVSGGKQLDSIQLNDATSSQEFAHRIGERAKVTAKSEWILGGNWDETKWNPPDMPTNELIDALAPDTPVFVSRYDGHMGLANSVALRLAGITAKTPDPPGGTIVRDSQGRPTGALKDAATDYIYKVVPPLSHDQRMKVAKRALAYAASVGVTSCNSIYGQCEIVGSWHSGAARTHAQGWALEGHSEYNLRPLFVAGNPVYDGFSRGGKGLSRVPQPFPFRLRRGSLCGGALLCRCAA
jgi:predicted amidohydrolase YtcJ